MGADWYRMRLGPSAPDADLPALVRQQAPAFSTYVQADEGAVNSRRVAGFVLNPIFPAEWRLAACRGYLPAELPGQLRQWESHVDELLDE